MQRSGGGSRPPKKKKTRAQRFGEFLFNAQYGPQGTKRGAAVRLYNIHRDSKGNKTVRPVSPSTNRRTPK